MIQLYLDSGVVYLFRPHPNGLEYSHQYDGVGCAQFEGRGNIEALGVSDSRLFNSGWWYKATHRYDEKNGPYLVPDFDWSKYDLWAAVMNEDEFIARQKDAEEAIESHPNKIYFKDLIPEMECELRSLGANVQVLEIVEALTKAIDEDGNELYIMWENCD